MSSGRSAVSTPTLDDFMALVSPAAPYLEPMAQLSRRYTQERFGKTVSMYIPMYITNSCTNSCVYCGFNRHNAIPRVILTPEQIEQECRAIRELGPFENLLLVTGENPRAAGVDYIEQALHICRPYFQQPDDRGDAPLGRGLRTPHACGHERRGLLPGDLQTKNYNIYHPAGMKSKFEWRVNGFDRMGQAGVHKIGMGVLIGLEEWRTDVTMMALHLQYLRKHYWKTRYSVNFPRMRPSEGHFQPNVVMSDRELAQLTFAFPHLRPRRRHLLLDTRAPASATTSPRWARRR